METSPAHLLAVSATTTKLFLSFLSPGITNAVVDLLEVAMQGTFLSLPPQSGGQIPSLHTQVPTSLVQAEGQVQPDLAPTALKLLLFK